MSKKKELLAVGAIAASCAAAAAGYSFLKNENKSDQPPKKLIETTKDNIFEKKFKNTSAAFEHKPEPEPGEDTTEHGMDETKAEPEPGEDTTEHGMDGTKAEPEPGEDTTEHGANTAR